MSTVPQRPRNNSTNEFDYPPLHQSWRNWAFIRKHSDEIWRISLLPPLLPSSPSFRPSPRPPSLLAVVFCRVLIASGAFLVITSPVVVSGTVVFVVVVVVVVSSAVVVIRELDTSNVIS